MFLLTRLVKYAIINFLKININNVRPLSRQNHLVHIVREVMMILD